MVLGSSGHIGCHFVLKHLRENQKKTVCIFFSESTKKATMYILRIYFCLSTFGISSSTDISFLFDQNSSIPDFELYQYFYVSYTRLDMLDVVSNSN